MAMNETKRPVYTTIHLEGVRIDFPCLTEGQRLQRGDEKYSVRISCPKGSEAHEALRKGIWEAIRANGAEATAKAPGYRIPLKDGDTEGKDYDKGRVFCKASSRKPVAVMDATCKAMTPEEIESVWGGSVCNVVLSAVPYDRQGNRGVALYLAAIQVVENAHKATFSAASYFHPIASSKSQEGASTASTMAPINLGGNPGGNSPVELGGTPVAYPEEVPF